MHFVIVDYRPDARAQLLGRAREAIRQVEVRRVEPVEVDLLEIDQFDWTISIGCLLGPGCQETLDETVQRVRQVYPDGRIAATLDRERYIAQAVNFRKRLGITIIQEGDLAQLASFIMDCESHGEQKGSGFKNRGVIGVTHFKGGVGATTVTAAFASCWARHGLNVCAIDFDDVNPQLSAVGSSWCNAARNYC